MHNKQLLASESVDQKLISDNREGYINHKDSQIMRRSENLRGSLLPKKTIDRCVFPVHLIANYSAMIFQKWGVSGFRVECLTPKE